jgi:hypothetical protein
MKESISEMVSKLPRPLVNWLLSGLLMGAGALAYAAVQYQVKTNTMLVSKVVLVQTDVDRTMTAVDGLVDVLHQQYQQLSEYRRDVKDLQSEQLETQKRMERILARIEAHQVDGREIVR